MIFIIFISQLWAQQVVIQGEQASDIAYEKFLLENPKHQSYMQYQKSLKNNLSEIIANHLKSAQFEFLNGSLEKAEDFFKKIIELQHKADWNKEDREIIHFSFLRLAQFAKTEKEKETYLLNAISFDDEVKVDTDIFPPPFVDKYKKIKRSILVNIWKLPEDINKFSEVLINGKKHPIDSSFIKMADGVRRLSFLSNRFKPIHVITKMSHLQNLKLTPSFLMAGTCESPILNDESIDKSKIIFIGDDCRGTISPTLQHLNLISIESQMKNPIKRPAFYKNKWFWLGVSVIATGALISSLSQQNKRSEKTAPPPTQTFSN